MANPNAIEQIYNQISQVFGSRNPNQFFSMLMPATTLDQQTYVYDTTGMKPALVAEAESELVDQMFDITPVTGSSNGQRVSEQYLQALSVLVPKFNPTLPVVKHALREFLNTQMPANTMLNEEPFRGTLQEYYYALYDAWVQLKLQWDIEQQNKKDELTAEPDANERFLEWFEGVAEGRLAEIDAAMGKVLSVFAPADMDAILSTLASGPGGEIDEAVNIVKDTRLFSPSGGYIYPVTLTPDNWFLNLSSDIDPTDLLKDPEFIAVSIAAKREALMATISQVQALLNSVPTPAAMQKAVSDMTTAQSNYTDAQNALVGTYADNTATAVNIYLSKHSKDSSPQKDDAAGDELDQNAIAASKAKGENPPATGATTKKGDKLSPEDVKQLVNGQKSLIAAQSGLLSSAQALATAGLNLAAAQSQTFDNLPVLLARMQQQLGDLETAQQQLSSSIVANTAPAPPAPLMSLTVRGKVIDAVNAAAQPTNSTAAAVAGAIVVPTSGDEIQALKRLKDAADGANQGNATAADVLTAVKAAAAQYLGAPTAAKSPASNGFMELQLSFKASDMSDASSHTTQFTQTSWAVDCFFGSASGSSSSSSSVTSQSSLDQDTEIQVAFKAAKVEINREWFNPGIFKLTKEMSRLSDVRVSAGSLPTVPPNNSDIDWGAVVNYQYAILPCFPVAFVVAKDVTLKFKATKSSLDAIHSVADSQSAAGGGFLCFSCSSSSSSHSDSQSLTTKTEDLVITIQMPGPQILGWFLETTPQDYSKNFDEATQPTDNINLLKYINLLQQPPSVAALPAASLKLKSALAGNGSPASVSSPAGT